MTVPYPCRVVESSESSEVDWILVHKVNVHKASDSLQTGYFDSIGEYEAQNMGLILTNSTDIPTRAGHF